VAFTTHYTLLIEKQEASTASFAHCWLVHLLQATWHNAYDTLQQWVARCSTNSPASELLVHAAIASMTAAALLAALPLQSCIWECRSAIRACCTAAASHAERFLQALPAVLHAANRLLHCLHVIAVAAVPASISLLLLLVLPLLLVLQLLMLLLPQPRNRSWPTVGRGLVNSMPATIMAGMKP
jgi:hypothetical protein